MQLTRFDRWLREKFVYETHIYTLRPPSSVPRRIRVHDLPDVPGKRYKHLYTTSNSRAAEELISLLKADNQMFSTQIVDRQNWYTSLVAPKGKSVTWWIVSAMAISASGVCALYYLKNLIDNPEFRKNFAETIEILKG